MPDLVRRRIVAHTGGEQCHFPQIAGHHYYARHRHKPYIAGEEHKRPAEGIDDESERQKQSQRDLAAQKTEYDAEHRRQHEYRAQHQDVVLYAQEILDVYDKVGHIYVVGDADDADRGIYQVEIAVAFYDGRSEPVHEFFEKAALLGFQIGAVLDQEYSYHAHEGRYPAEHAEEGHPLPVLRKRIEDAEYHEQRGERHYLKYAFGFSPVAVIGNVGYPCVERGVVGSRADSGHHAVHDDYHDRRKRDGICRRKQLCRVFFGNERERKYADAPEYVTYADEEFAFADLVGQPSREQRDDRRDDRARRDHRTRCVEIVGHRLVEIHVEIHVFDHPGNLPDQAEQHDARPYPCTRLSFEFHNVFSLDIIIYLLGRGFKTRRKSDLARDDINACRGG